MSFDAHGNFVYGTVTACPSPATSGTHLSVKFAAGTTIPTPPFNCVVWPRNVQPLAGNAEIVRVTARTGEALTIERTQEGSAARTVLVGDQFAAAITAKALTDVQSALAGIESGEHLPSSVVSVSTAYAENGLLSTVQSYGAVCNAISSATGVTTTGASAATLTDPNAAFASTDVGKVISINGAGTAGTQLVTTIATFISTTQVTLSTPASTAVSPASYVYGTDDTVAIQAAINSGNPVAFTGSKPALVASSLTLTTSTARRFWGRGADKYPTILYVGTGYCFSAVSSTPESPGINSLIHLNFSGVIVSGFGGTNQSGAWNCDGVYKVTLEQSVAELFAGAAANGAQFQNCFNLDFKLSSFLKCGQFGINIAGTSGDNQITNVAVDNCLIQNNGVSGISISPLVQIGGFCVTNTAFNVLYNSTIEGQASSAINITGKVANFFVGQGTHIQIASGQTGTNNSIGIVCSGANLFMVTSKFDNIDFYGIHTLFKLNGSEGTCRNVEIDNIYATGAGGTSGVRYNFNAVTGFVWIGGSFGSDGSYPSTNSTFTKTRPSLIPGAAPSLTYNNSETASFTALPNTSYSISNALTVTLPTPGTESSTEAAVGDIVEIIRANVSAIGISAAGAGVTIDGQASLSISASSFNNHPSIRLRLVLATLWHIEAVNGTDADQGLRVDAGLSVGGALNLQGKATLAGELAHTGTKAGLYGVTPVVRAAAIAEPAETLAALKTAVNALREAVKKVGITE